MTLLFLLLPLWMLFCVEIGKKYKLESIVWLAFFVIYPLVNFYTFSSLPEFLKTYLQFLLCVFAFFILYNSRPVIQREELLSAIRITQFILLSFLVVQYIMVVKFHQDWLYNPWGAFSWLYPLRRDEYNFFRMKGFFLEPSYVAFVMFSLFVSRYIMEGRIKRTNVALSLTSLLFINSSFGFLAFFVIIPLILFFKVKGRSRIYFLGAAVIILLLLSPALINGFVTATKLNSLGAESYTSAYTRWIFPINLVIYIFSNGYVSGYGMGQLDPIIANFDLIIINSGEAGVSNSLASLLIYFGFASVLLIAYLLFKFVRGDNYKKVFIVFLLVSLSNTGAFNTIEFCFMSMILPFTALRLKEYVAECNYSLL